MSNPSWFPGRLIWALGCVLCGVVAAFVIARPANVTRAQENPGRAGVDERWLALLTSERSTLDQPTDADGVAAGALTLNVLMQDAAIAGFAPTGNPVSITVSRPGSVQETATATPFLTEAGWFYSWTWLSLGEYNVPGFQAGDVIRVAQGGQTLTLTANAFGAEASSATDRVSGVSAANVDLVLHGLSALDPALVFTATATADSQGAFVFDLAGVVDLSAGDHGFVRQTLDATRSVAARFATPQLQVQVDGNTVSGFVAPRQSFSVRVLQGSMVLAEATGIGGADGGFSLCVSTSCWSDLAPDRIFLPGRRVELIVGDQTLSMAIPTLTARSTIAEGRVSGMTDAGARVTVYRWPGPLAYNGGSLGFGLDSGVAVTASATGAYTAGVPLQPADYGAAVVRDVNGHLAYARYAVAQLRIDMGSRGLAGALIRGQLDRISTPVTVTIIGGLSGLPKAEVRSSTTPTGWLQVGVMRPTVQQSGLLLSGGDVVSITDASGLVALVPLQPISVTADVPTQRISGQGPVSATLPIHLENFDSYPAWPNGYDTLAFSDLAGFFGIDVTDFRIKSTTRGTVQWTNPDGHTLVRSFAAGPTCLPDVGEVRVNGNTLVYASDTANWTTCGWAMTLTLRSSSGALKHEATMPAFSGSDSFELLADQGGPVRIEPGDVLSIVNGTRAMTLSVPLISVNVDVSTQRITGNAPAGSTVHVVNENGLTDIGALGGPSPSWTATAIADAGGAYQLEGQFRPGDRIEASVTNRLGTAFTAVAVVPAIELSLYGGEFRGVLPPLSPLTVTLQTTRAVTPTTFTHRVDDLGRIRGMSYLGSTLLPWAIRPGDRVLVQAGSYQRDWLIPPLTAEVDTAAQMLRGVAPPNHRLTAVALSSGSVSRSIVMQSDPSGRYAVELPADFFPENGLRVTLHTDSGDRLSLVSGAMMWNIQLHSACLMLRTPRSFATATLTLFDGQGRVRSTQTLSGAGQTFWPLCLSDQAGPVIPRPGDHFRLVADSGEWSFTVPTLSVTHDPRRGIVTGGAPGGGFATISFSTQTDNLLADGRTVTIDAAGRFGVDVTDLTWRPGQPALLLYTDRAGNTVELAFILTGIQHWLTWIGHP